MPTSTGTSNCQLLLGAPKKNGPAPPSSPSARPRAVASWHQQWELRPSRGALRRGRLRSHRWSSCGCGTAAVNSLVVRREDDFGGACVFFFSSVSFCLLQQKVTGLCPDLSLKGYLNVFDASLKHFQGDANLLVVAPDYGVCFGLRGSCSTLRKASRGSKPEGEVAKNVAGIVFWGGSKPNRGVLKPNPWYFFRRSTLDEFLGSMVRNPWYRCRWENCVVPCAAA